MSLHRTLLSPIVCFLSAKPGIAAVPLLITVLLLLCSPWLSAQPTSYPVIADAGKTMETFIPQGWHFYDSTSGDLNKDQLNDLAFVIEQDAVEEPEEKDGSEEVYEEGRGPARILVVLFKQKDGGYRRSVQSNTCVLRDGDGGVLGDPWAGMEVNRGSLVLHFYGGSAWRWGLDYRFRFQDEDWFLIGATNVGYHSSSGEMESCDYNLLTGDVEITNGNVFGEECRACDDCRTCEPCERCGECETCVPVEDQIVWKKIDKGQLRRMAEFVPWEWEIMPDHYI